MTERAWQPLADDALSSLSSLLSALPNRILMDEKGPTTSVFNFQPPRSVSLQRDWSVGEQIGSGGFGTVFLMESPGVDPHVAKFIPKDPGADRELLFPKLSGIRNVVPVPDSGEWDGYWIILMPRAKQSLADLLSSPAAPVSVADAKGILIDVAEALASMDGSIVHRDVKPANILLVDDCWCLADFGISQYADPRPPATTATETRKFALTAPYAAPERWRNERASSATDIYALGVVAYELLAGRIPFLGPQRHEFRQQHLHELPGPITAIPPGVASLVDECLTKAPGARPSAANVVSRLQQATQPKSEAGRRLQEANLGVVRQQTERARIAARARSERERKQQLREAAKVLLRRIVALLDQRICSLASACTANGDESSGWRFTLGNACLEIEPVQSADTILSEPGRLQGEVIASTAIRLRIPRDRYGNEGRSHSLWYLCRGDDTYRWYELAFTIHALIPKRARVDPFSLPPGSENAQEAIRGGMHEYDLGEAPVTIDQGHEEDFVERWIARFADAVTGGSL